MSKTKIEWCDYTINPVKGLCPMACDYCYARRMYKRFKWNTDMDFNPFWANELPKKPSKIFICSTIELFHDSILDKWREQIFGQIRTPFIQNQGHTFIFLTKQPQNLAKWSPFPNNCWVGVSATNASEVLMAVNYLFNHHQAKTQFLSIEPLLSWDTSKYTFPYTFASSISKKDLDWIIIGQQTPVSKKTQPKIEWIQDIIESADKAKIPVFLKNNILGDTTFFSLPFRQELPHMEFKSGGPNFHRDAIALTGYGDELNNGQTEN